MKIHSDTPIYYLHFVFQKNNTMPSVSVKDVSQQDFVVAMAAHLKKSGKMKVPEWVDIVKTNVGKELVRAIRV